MYDEEREYVREIYWESKGLGKSTTAEEKKVEFVMEAQCSKCHRWGSVESVARHNEKFPECDK